jgi:hypothetical protein
MFRIKFKYLILIFLLFSCQQIEILDDIVFDYNQLPKIVISAEKKNVKELYESKFAEPYIDHSLDRPPQHYLNKWFENNLNIIGKENIFVINIIDASLKQSEIPNIDSKKYKEKNIFLFEVSFLVEFILYDDSSLFLANTIAEARRTTTSSKFISLIETERIIDSLILDCLKDFSKKSEELIRIHMESFIL